MLERQKENVKTLLTLIEQNPNLRIVPMVDMEVFGGDDFAWWVAGWGSASVEEIWSDDERIYIRTEDEEDLIYDLACNMDLEDEEAERMAMEKVNSYEWEKVIAVKITI